MHAVLVYLYVVYVCVYTHRCLEVRGHCEVTSPITYILRQGPSLDLELTSCLG